MAKKSGNILKDVLKKYSTELVDGWMKVQRAALKSGQIEDADMKGQAERFLAALSEGVDAGENINITGETFRKLRDILEEASSSRALAGFTPTETATFVFSFKEPLFEALRDEVKDAHALADELWTASALLDKLGLYTTEVYRKSREEVIARQQEEMLELSTPVVQLWEGVLALPLIGTLDSGRTQVVMETLLQEIVKVEAQIAIIDITGVPTVDTLVAQHLLKTVSAARLMGADCIISGIRPQIAQTLVHLGVDLNVVSKATMADAFALALRRIGKTVVTRKKGPAPSPEMLTADEG
jgi:rsbT co-antagonist protein RsbR